MCIEKAKRNVVGYVAGVGGWWWSEDKEGTYERGYICEYVTSSKLRRDRSDDVSNVRVVSSMLTLSPSQKKTQCP